MAEVNTVLHLPAALLTGLADLGLETGAQAGTSFEDAPVRGDVTIARGSAAQRFDVLCGRGVRTTDIAKMARGDLPRLVLTDYVPDVTAESFRRAGVQYLDEAGNAWISFGTVLVDIRGRRRVGASERPPAVHGSLFSTKSSQVVLALLAWPTLWRATRRDVARAAGVSLGKTHDALTLLEQGGFGPDAMRRSNGELLDLWAAAYPTGLARKLVLGRFHGPANDVRSVDGGDRLYVSGEGAVDDLLKPATLDVYVAELKPRLAIVNRWRTDGPTNITVRRRFWEEPSGERASGDQPVAAPWPLVYADLIASTDPRVRAAAGDWKDRHAGPSERP